MAIEKKLKIRRIGNTFSYQGLVREVPDSGNQPAGQWKEATDWIDRDMVRQAAPEEEVKNYCKTLTNLYILRNPQYTIEETEETFE